jgi:hypothetical protein
MIRCRIKVSSSRIKLIQTRILMIRCRIKVSSSRIKVIQTRILMIRCRIKVILSRIKLIQTRILMIRCRIKVSLCCPLSGQSPRLAWCRDCFILSAKRIPILKGAIENKTSHTAKNIQNVSVKKLELLAHPNPFSETTTVEYVIPDGAQSNILYLLDVFGNDLRRFAIVGTGAGKLLIDGSTLVSGVYYCRLVSDKKSINFCKLVIIK